MKPEVWDGHYTKREYIVHLSGECVRCWPNAGLMYAIDGTGRVFKPDGKTVVSIMTDAEADRYDAEDRAQEAARPFPLALAAGASPAWADLHLRERKRLKRQRSRAKKKKRKR